MAVYHIVDQHLVSDREYLTRANDIVNFLDARAAAGKALTPLSLSRGRSLAVTAPAATSAAAAPSTNDFTPIGLNKPLSIVIRHVYTGKYPERAIFGHRGDMAIVSGVRNFSTTDASARALNFLEAAVTPNSHFNGPGAFSQGTPLVAYSPAVTDPALTITFEMATANDFVSNLLAQISGGFQALAGIPIMLPYAGYLLGAGSLLKLGQGITDALYDSVPAFQDTETLNFDLPGSNTTADWRFIASSGFDVSKFTYQDGVGLKDSSGLIYSGDNPYLVISLDGKARDQWKGFTPAVTSAAVLQKFFSVKDGGSVAVNTIVSALSLYSDMMFRNKADELKSEIASPPPGTDVAALQAQLNAVIQNITDPKLRPAV